MSSPLSLRPGRASKRPAGVVRSARLRLAGDAIDADREVAGGDAEQHRRGADQAASGLEHVDPGVALVDDGERQVLVVGAGQHPGRRIARVGRGPLGGEVRRRLTRRGAQPPTGCQQQPNPTRHPDSPPGRR
jgi:hypothetical protein